MIGISKLFGISHREALYDISYVNAMMFSKAAAMPESKVQQDERPPFDDSLDACNPDNFSMEEDEEVVRV